MSIESMPSNHLILCHPLLLPPSIFPSIRVFSKVSVLLMRWPKYQSFSFSKELMDAAKCFLVYSEYAEEDMAAVKKHIDSERLEMLKRALKSVSGYSFRIGQKIGGQF